MITKELITTKQLADVLQVSAKHIWNLQKEQVIPSIKVGGALRYDLDLVLKSLERNGTD